MDISSKMRGELGQIAVGEEKGKRRPLTHVPKITWKALFDRGLVRTTGFNPIVCELTPEGRALLGEEYFKGVRAGLAEQAKKA